MNLCKTECIDPFQHLFIYKIEFYFVILKDYPIDIGLAALLNKSLYECFIRKKCLLRK